MAQRFRRRIRRTLKPPFDAVVGWLAVALLRTIKLADRKHTANFIGGLMRKAGPLLKEHRIGRDNLRAAFPEKSDAEIETILLGVWENLGRVVAEFAHLDEFHIEGLGPPGPADITYPPDSRARYDRIIASGRTMIGFAAHLGNWEIPALGATLLGVRSAALYRPPNIGAVSDAVIKTRAGIMGELIPTGLDAPVRLARLLGSGVHVGMLVDQHYTRGVEVTFFGRPCKANPLVAMLARQTGCPIHGLRVVRNPDGNSFWGEVTEAIETPRDADGRVDIQGTMQAITSVVEGWVREHPEQWLWLHRRWR
jgi:Kdo2-lipid IVA lauroyltransferase/acyltransferase